MKDSKKRAGRTVLLGLLGVALFLGLWQLLMTLGIISSRTMSTPGQVLHTFFLKLTQPEPDGATVQEHFLSSFKLAMAGFGTAVAKVDGKVACQAELTFAIG